MWKILTYLLLKVSQRSVDSFPTTLNGGTKGITVSASLGVLKKTIPTKKLSSSGENLLDKVAL